MAVFKCKMCGGDLDVAEGATTGTCTYCGSVQTLPRLDSEERTNLFDRAGHYLRNNDYDKALAVYERILDMDNTDPEAHWSLLLCRYGVEYVDDPKTHRKMLTCNRTVRKSILADADYRAALDNATDYARQLYEAEAAEIDRIQKAALAIIDQEEPFDVFICYKQTDRTGRPTKDSRRAQDIYDALSKEGYKVFFSKVTLEDRLGTEYEPYIFAALASAKVMVAVGTSKENFGSPWVRNEWSRFLAMAEMDSTKKLIPAYEDMDPYDMPDEFAMLQALNMDSFTFVQDLMRGIDKLLRGGGGGVSATGSAGVGGTGIHPAPTTVSVASAATPLVKRARLMCEDGDFAKAQELVEQALNLDPESGEVYVVALMAECQCKQEEQLGSLVTDELSQRGNYQKALRFGDAALKVRLDGYDAQAKENWAEKRRVDAEEQRKRAEREAEEQRRRDEAQAVQRREAERVAAVIKPVEDFLNGKATDDATSKKRREEIRTSLAHLSAQEQQLRSQRKSLGLFAGEQKRQIDSQMDAIATQRQGLESEVRALSGKSQPARYQWRIIGLDEANNRALAITRDIIAKMPYHQPGGSITWADCTLRRWLNLEFYSSLPAHIKSRVVEVTNQNSDNPHYGTAGGAPTRDKVFLLSVNEANRYFKDNNDRRATCEGTGHWWWLRSPGDNARYAANVSYDGDVYVDGNYVVNSSFGVRPALWLNL
jgi:tetratricopeptide (TPR) repeat protein